MHRFARNRDITVRRDHVDRIRFNRQGFGGFANRHAGSARQNFGQLALMSRVKVLHQHERHTRVYRQGVQKLREGV